jgi:hypothetical protein
MNPHIVFNFNLAPGSGQPDGASQASGDAALPAPDSAMSVGLGTADRAGSRSGPALPSPMGAGALSAEANVAGLPTPFDPGSAGSVFGGERALPSPLDEASARARSPGQGAGKAQLPAPMDFPAQAATAREQAGAAHLPQPAAPNASAASADAGAAAPAARREPSAAPEAGAGRGRK